MILRQKFFIDKHVQGILIGRVIIYWVFGLTYLGLGTACFQYYEHPDWTVGDHASSLFSQFGPWLPSLILLLPLVVYDIIRLSNQFTGPVYRLRTHLSKLATDGDGQPFSLRTDDYWQDLLEPVNQLQSELQELRQQLEDQKTQAQSTGDPGAEIAADTKRTVPSAPMVVVSPLTASEDGVAQAASNHRVKSKSARR